ncbi:hypothetical protein AB0E62_29245 [Streptomyces sp. NPDC038707]|uniref:DUF6924 domain-containing protein n=1 Tax=Streptomyces sp. NPDC038707 TaxID=3154329 RepID=UPI0033F669EB
MPLPRLPRPAPADALLVCTWYEDGEAQWGELPAVAGGRRDGDLVVLGSGGVRLRPAEDPAWDDLRGGSVPALLPAGGPVPPVAVLADLPARYGGGPLLVDLTATPGRGARVPAARLGEILAALLDATLTFDDLVRGLDTSGVYQGGSDRPAFPTPTAVTRRSFPELPSASASLLVRTAYDDEAGWRALLDELGGIDEGGWIGPDPDADDHPEADDYPWEAVVVDDPVYAGLQPGQVPALVPRGEHTTMVALADTGTFTRPGRPLTVVDLYDTPGHTAVLPCRRVGSMACNLDLGNMDFRDFVAAEGVRPWWEE